MGASDLTGIFFIILLCITMYAVVCEQTVSNTAVLGFINKNLPEDSFIKRDHKMYNISEESTVMHV